MLVSKPSLPMPSRIALPWLLALASIMPALPASAGLDTSFASGLAGARFGRMQAFIADNPKDKHGIHRDEPHEFGALPEVVRREFRASLERFGLAPE